MLRLAAAALLLALAAPAAALAQDEGAIGGPDAALARAYLVGAWTDTDDCASAVAFVGDGTFVTPEGGEGLWHLDHAELTLAGAGGIQRVLIVPLDADTMEVIGEDGTRGRSIRCAAEDGEEEGAEDGLDLAGRTFA